MDNWKEQSVAATIKNPDRWKILDKLAQYYGWYQEQPEPSELADVRYVDDEGYENATGWLMQAYLVWRGVISAKAKMLEQARLAQLTPTSNSEKKEEEVEDEDV